MMMEKYNVIKEKFIKMKDWAMKHPKQVYLYIMVTIVFSFALSFIQYFYFTPKVPITNLVPNFYSKSNTEVQNASGNEKEMEKIVSELQQYKMKRQEAPLTKNDSLRIEYLFNQYQNLKNGH